MNQATPSHTWQFATENLCKYFRSGMHDEVRAVDDVSLEIPDGSFVVLAGESGSGKTTLLSLLAGLDFPTQGRVRFEDRELSSCSGNELARLRRRMGIVFQNYALLPKLVVEDNVTYPLIARGIAAARRREIAGDLLGQLGLADKIAQRPEQLSGGEQQRVAVARALAGDPEVILADEPTSNLDRRSSTALCEIFQRIHESGRTVIVSTHDPDLMRLATHVFELEDGRLRATTSEQGKDAEGDGQ